MVTKSVIYQFNPTKCSHTLLRAHLHSGAYCSTCGQRTVWPRTWTWNTRIIICEDETLPAQDQNIIMFGV